MTPADLRSYLLAHAPDGRITSGVRWCAAEYQCSEPSVWRWLGARGAVPKWLAREIERGRAVALRP